ncbi:hypothetical protein AAG570_010773 [Ranatra chinensis]|uniref:Protein kintoun n=1 Tax=Ranatra chinensis TaxID=642074 RepID=A0ABD0YNJ4_9HEMI
MTKEEFEQIKDAFKKEEFRKMFANYVNEVNDPKNRAIYESEITQMEKDRGVDITFVHPVPGYVIKTSVDGKQKAFINICQNDNVGKPSSKPATQQGTSGADWSVPYIQAAPKIDLDKNRNRCLVYDVVFHPDTLFLARENNAFRKFVNDTALMAVEDNYNVKLDRRNLKFPKMKFKGAQQATVIRRKRTDMSDVKDPDELFDIPNYPYEPLAENPSPIVTKVKEEPTQTYTTPHYILNHRKEVDMHEFSYAPDAKMYAATPTELILKIDLPLIKSALDMNLDVCERSLLLVTEGTAKYKLEVKLPWPVDEDAGTAKFDKSTKQLHITLPVKRKPLGPAVDPSHEDSGVESDHNPPKSSSDEDTSDNTFPSESGVVVEETLRTSPFLDPDAHYSFPSYTLNPCERSLAAVLDTPKVDSTSLKYRLIPQGVHLCFVSLGSGFFPINYTFCIKVMGGEFNPGSLNVDISEDNVVVKLIVLCHDTLDACHFLIGPQPDSLTEKFTMFPSVVSAKCDAKPQVIFLLFYFYFDCGY